MNSTGKGREKSTGIRDQTHLLYRLTKIVLSESALQLKIRKMSRLIVLNKYGICLVCILSLFFSMFVLILSSFLFPEIVHHFCGKSRTLQTVGFC